MDRKKAANLRIPSVGKNIAATINVGYSSEVDNMNCIQKINLTCCLFEYQILS